MNTAVAILVWVAVIAAYWVPTAVAAVRHIPNLGPVIVLNIFGFTGVCWVIAMAFSVRTVPPPPTPLRRAA